VTLGVDFYCQYFAKFSNSPSLKQSHMSELGQAIGKDEITLRAAVIFNLVDRKSKSH
jgi:hypothetical protein